MSCTGIDATATAHASRFPTQRPPICVGKVKARTGTSSARSSLASKLQELNPILRGWANYHRHCAYAGRCSPVSTGTLA
nr:group II intron maturase-specific domain-containing protein [Mesorhizobium escarrei]